MGALGAMAPKRRGLITSVAIRAFIVGSIVCFISASFAGKPNPLINLSENRTNIPNNFCFIQGILMQNEEEERSYERILSSLQRKNISIVLFQKQS